MKGVKYPQTFIELFAGCGGNVLGYIKAGLKCLAAVERAPEACYTMWTNLAWPGFTHFKCGEENLKKLEKIVTKDNEKLSIFTHIPGNDWLQQTDEVSPVMSIYCADMSVLEPEQLMEDLGLKPGELGHIAGGPPCQGFSTANSDRHMLDERNQLPLRYLHFVDVFQPAMFQMENVPGILTLGKAKGDPEGPFPMWLREKAEAIGYHFEYRTHNAVNYGVPQTRKRVLFIGIRKDLYENGMRFPELIPTHTWSFHDALKDGTILEKLATGKEPWVNVHEAIGDLGRWFIGASRDKDAIKQPEGHKDRRSNLLSGKDVEIREDNFIYYRDKFSGEWHKGNEQNDYGSHNMHYYKSCLYCGKLNLIVRSQCHYCENQLSPIPDFNYLKDIVHQSGDLD